MTARVGRQQAAAVPAGGDEPGRRPARDRVLLAVGAAACAALAFVLRVPYMRQPLDRDSALYAAIGDRMGLTTLPYRDLFDHKQPLTHYVYWAIETVAPAKVLPIRLAAAAVAAALGVLLVTALARRIGAPRAIAAGVLATAVLASPALEGGDLNPEHLLALTGAAAVLVPLALERSPRRWLPFAVGVLGGVAALSKAVGALPALAALIPLIAGRDARGQSVPGVLARYAIGALAPVALVVVWYAAHGALDDFWLGNVTYNRRYGEQFPRDWFPDHAQTRWLIAFALVAGVARLVAHEGRDTLSATLLFWLLAATLGTQLAGREFPHYFVPVVVPAVALLLAPLGSPAAGLRRAAAAATVVAVLGVGWLFLKPLAGALGKNGDEVARLIYGEDARRWSEYFAVRDVIVPRAGPDDRLFVAGAEPGYYWATRMRPATPLLFDYPVGLMPETFTARMTGPLCERPPEWLVMEADTVPPYAACLDLAGYEVVAEFPVMSVWRRAS